MKRIAAAPALVLALSALLVSALPAGATQGPPGSYGTKTPYAPQQDARSYQRAPKGFAPVFTENVTTCTASPRP
ncbi:hypothetical protein [Streptomyces fagopyri]|uniref:hypothetical protein n=1 Tax=Streptomyces fagopyri TaxID=2662397 RepID=UPI00371C7ED4